MVDAFAWCVRVIRQVLLEACHKILGGYGESGEQVQGALTVVRGELQEHTSAVEAAAGRFAIDVPVLSEAAHAEGRHPVPVLEEETASRQEILTDAQAAGVDDRAVHIAAEQVKLGSGFAAVKAATELLQNAKSAAERFDLDVDAICATARSRGEDPARVLVDEATSCQKILFAVEVVGMSTKQFDATFTAAEAERRGSGYAAVADECIRIKRRGKVREVLPFEYSRSAGTMVAATSEESEALLLQGVADEHFVHGDLSAVLAQPHGRAVERAQAEHDYHLPAIGRELRRLEDERGWLGWKPTQQKAKDAVLAQFIPKLAERVCAACDSVTDIDSVLTCAVEDDRVRRVVEDLPQALPREEVDPGTGSRYAAASGEALRRAVATKDDAFLSRVIVAYQAKHSRDAGPRAQAVGVRRERLRKDMEAESGLTREQAEAAATQQHAAELLRILDQVCRRIQSRTIEEIVDDLLRDRRVERAAAPPQARGLSLSQLLHRSDRAQRRTL